MAPRVTARRRQLLADLDRESRRTGAVSALHAKALASRLGLHDSDFECIDVLDWTGPIAAGELARRVGLTSGAVTGVIDRLEQRGWVRRSNDPTDRRRVIVELTNDEERLRDVGPVFGQLASEMAAINDDYDDEQLALVTEWLERATGAVERSIERLRAAQA